jgi:RNA polymerase sigma-70 factor (sigma-E family)
MAYPGDVSRVPQAAPDGVAVAHPPDRTGGAGPGGEDRSESGADATLAVTALYQAHALGLTRLAFIMLGDRQAAEDVVQEAFYGLYRAWDRLADRSNVLGYLRVSVLNGCRSDLRRARRVPRPLAVPPAASAEADALAGEEQRAAVAALRRLPPRQREALVLRYFAELPEQETALAMGVSRGTVKSTAARALTALGRMLREDQ